MLALEERKQIISKLFIALKESNIFPGYTLLQIKEAAVRAEQRIYEESGSREEYLRGMNERFERIQNAMAAGARGGAPVARASKHGFSDGMQSGEQGRYAQTELRRGSNEYSPGMKPQGFVSGYTVSDYANAQQMRSMSEHGMRMAGDGKGFREVNGNTMFQGQVGGYDARSRIASGNMQPQYMGLDWYAGGGRRAEYHTQPGMTLEGGRAEGRGYDSGFFVPPQHRERAGHNEPMFRMGPEASPSNSYQRMDPRPSQELPMMPNTEYKHAMNHKGPGFAHPPLSDPIKHPRNPTASQYPANAWGFSPAMDGKNRSRQQPDQFSGRTAPIFFNQQVQHNQFPREQFDPGAKYRSAYEERFESAQAFPSMFNGSEGMFSGYGEVPFGREAEGGLNGAFEKKMPDEERFGMAESSWPHMHGKKPAMQPEWLGSSAAVDFQKESISQSHRSLEEGWRQSERDGGSMDLSEKSAGEQRATVAVPAEVETFLRENKTEKMHLSDIEMMSLEAKLREGMSVIEKSSEIYESFRGVFPNSQLSNKYETIKTLLVKQNEYLKYRAFFLKMRSVDNFIDQLKSLTVDMSYDLKSNTAAGEVNHGECLRNAVKAFSEKKRKKETFCLDISNKEL